MPRAKHIQRGEGGRRVKVPLVKSRTAFAAALAVSGLVLGGLVPPATAAEPAPGSADAYYSATADLPMARSALGLRRFLSTTQPQYDEQSYVWWGALVDYDGTRNAVAVEMQRNDKLIDGFIPVPEVDAAILYNQGDDPGYAIGGLGGLPELTTPVTFTSSPWTARVESFTPGQQPDFIDIRVVAGQFGRRGAVYEFTTSVPNLAPTAPVGERITTYIRAKDVFGIQQWGYGPSGYIPMWIFSAQRAQIMDDFGGSVGDYLEATGDPMLGQGTYYWTEPLLQVQRFKVSINGRVVSAGDEGWMWLDNVERSFNAQAQEIVNGKVSWQEFSIMIPSSRTSLKVGYTKQALVGTYPYASMVSPDSAKARNGAWAPAATWPLQAIHMRPIKGSEWTNPVTGNTYYLKQRVELDRYPGGPRASFVVTSSIPDQEAVVLGRAVFEGLFRVTGTIDGEPVSGWAWGELQPASTL